MGFIDKTEKKLGKFAIPGLTMKLIVIQCIFFLFFMMKAESKTVNGQKVISFDPALEIIHRFNIGETTIISDLLLIIGSPGLLPIGFLSLIFLFFVAQLLMIFGNSLEELWGTYKYNLFILTSVVGSLLIMQLVGRGAGDSLPYFTSAIYLAIFFAFSTHFPKFSIHVMFILPVPVMLLSLFAFLMLALSMMNMSTFGRAYWLAGAFIPYILFHFGHFAHRQKQRVRAASFEKKIQTQDAAAFHKCAVCGKTENDEGDLEFRISGDGEEYCLEHLKK